MGFITRKLCPVCESEKIKPVLSVKDYSYSNEEYAIYRCTNCNLGFTQNAPDENSISEYYNHDSYVSHNDSDKGVIFKAYHAVRRYMLGYKEKIIRKHAPVGDILDIGAGTGYFLNYMQSKGWRATGMEPEKKARDIAKEKFNINLHPIADFDTFPEKKFSVVSMWHVLEHVHQLDTYFENIRSKLTDNGIFTIAVPNFESKDAKFYGKYWAAWDIPIHLWHFTPNSIKHLAQKHNFELLKMYSMPFDPFYISILSEKNAKNGFFGFIRAMFIGLYSFILGTAKTTNSSSIIYILTKKQ